MTSLSFSQQSENSEINVSRKIRGSKRCEMVEKGKQKLTIKDVMNNHILHETGGSKFLKTLTLMYQTRRRRITQCHNIYI
jgi:hypothetical protein